MMWDLSFPKFAPKPIDIVLDWSEVTTAAITGVRRRVSAMYDGRVERFVDDSSAFWARDVHGALAEIVLAKHLNMYWSGTVGRIDCADVGKLQVRSKLQADHRLIVHPYDKDQEIFVLVFLDVYRWHEYQSARCQICGWVYGHEGKQHGVIVKNGDYFISNEFLHPMEELPLAADLRCAAR